MSNQHTNPFALAPVAVVFFFSDCVRFAGAFSEPSVRDAAQTFSCAGATSTDHLVGNLGLEGLEPGGWFLAFHDGFPGTDGDDLLDTLFWAAAGSEWSDLGTVLFSHPETGDLFAKPL